MSGFPPYSPVAAEAGILERRSVRCPAKITARLRDLLVMLVMLLMFVFLEIVLVVDQTMRLGHKRWKTYSNWYGVHMSDQGRPMTNREVLHEIALGEFGLVSTKDAQVEGIAAVELRKLAGRGALERVGHGLYRDPSVPTTQLDQYALAVRLVGDDAYLMGDAVLARHNLALVNPSRITVGTPHRVWKTLPPMVRAVQRRLPQEALVVDDGIMQTTLFQAIVDCMGSVMSDRLRDAISVAGRNQLLTGSEQDALRARLARRHDRKPR